MKPKLIIVGSGFFGATIANLCAERLGVPVCIYEKRDHIGGNAFSYFERLKFISMGVIFSILQTKL